MTTRTTGRKSTMAGHSAKSRLGGRGGRLWFRWPAAMLLLLLWLIPAAGAAGAAGERSLRLAPLPLENQAEMVKSFSPLAAYLSSRLGREVELVVYHNHAALIDAFVADEVDIAFFGPLPFVEAQNRGAQPVPLAGFREADGSARYRCALIASGLDRLTPADLRGRAIGLVSPSSTCGYLGTNAILLEQAGFSLEETSYRYLHSHEAVALAVAAGEVAAGGVKESYARKYAPLDIVILGQSAWLPPFALAANGGTISAAEIQRLSEVLLSTQPVVYRRWGPHLGHGMDPVQAEDYEALGAFGNLAEIPSVPPAKDPTEP